MSKETIILLYGGRSAERDVSVLSAESVMRAVNYHRFNVQTYFITKDGDFIKTQYFEAKPSDDERLMTNDKIDFSKQVEKSTIYQEKAIVFPVLHGPMGEDGSIQGFLEVLKMPYVGTGILASSTAMDKIITKNILNSQAIPQVAYDVVIEGDDVSQKVESIIEQLDYPLFVKPSNLGSSVGISKVNSKEELYEAIDLAFRYDSRVLVEQGVNAREVEVAILGNENIKTTLPGEVIKAVDFYDYQAKYIDNQIKMAIPADLDADVVEKMRHYAERFFRAIGGTGLARCDFFYTDKGEIFLNELNTMPGFTQWSMYPLLWENMGLSYQDLIEELVRLAKAVFNRRERQL